MLYIALGALFVLVIVLFAAQRSYLKRRTERKTLLADFIDEIRGIEAELNRVTDRNIALVEDSLSKLSSSIKEADEKIASSMAAINALTEKRNDIAEAEKRLEEAREELRKSEEAYGDKPLPERIAALKRRGFSSAHIAQKLDKTIAEIEFLSEFSRNVDAAS